MTKLQIAKKWKGVGYRVGYAAAIEDIAKFVADYPGNTYTMDCDHKELAEKIKALLPKGTK